MNICAHLVETDLLRVRSDYVNMISLPFILAGMIWQGLIWPMDLVQFAGNNSVVVLFGGFFFSWLILLMSEHQRTTNFIFGNSFKFTQNLKKFYLKFWQILLKFTKNILISKILQKFLLTFSEFLPHFSKLFHIFFLISWKLFVNIFMSQFFPTKLALRQIDLLPNENHMNRSSPKETKLIRFTYMYILFECVIEGSTNIMNNTWYLHLTSILWRCASN